jgi:hypothetical protein
MYCIEKVLKLNQNDPIHQGLRPQLMHSQPTGFINKTPTTLWQWHTLWLVLEVNINHVNTLTTHRASCTDRSISSQ